MSNLVRTFMGKTSDEWVSIYQLLTFGGKEIKSLKDMMHWRAPDSPIGCLEVGLVLLEARNKVDPNPVFGMLERFAFASRTEINQKDKGVSIKETGND